MEERDVYQRLAHHLNHRPRSHPPTISLSSYAFTSAILIDTLPLRWLRFLPPARSTDLTETRIGHTILGLCILALSSH